jgi:Cd2+/Zn2+-exporting ATPase
MEIQLPFKDRKFIYLLLSVFIVIVFEILSLLQIYIPMPFAPIVFAAFCIGIGYGVICEGLQAIYKLNFSSINLLMLFAVIGAFILGEYPEAAVVIVLYVLGERLEEIGIESSKTALDELVNRSPKTAFVRDVQKQIDLREIPIGTIILIKSGDQIPLDGEIIKGEVTVDEAPITGEPIAKDKHVGDELFAGTFVKNGFVELKTTKISTDTTFAKIIRLTFESNLNKSDTQKFIQKFSKFYTPTVLGISILLFLIPTFILDLDWQLWLKQAITLLVIACPCALVISTPVAIYAAIGNASAKGILVKGGKYIEAMAGIKAIALDKTRTITYGNPSVSDVLPLSNTSREELLSCLSGAEILSEHPIAQAIVQKTLDEKFVPHTVEKFQSIPGKGTIAKCLVCKDETIYAGKLSFIQEHQHVDQESIDLVKNLSDQGKTSVVVSFGNGVAGIIGLTDEIKEDSLNAISELKDLGVTPFMLTGDNEKAALYVANKVSISEVFANQLPDEKATVIDAALKKYGLVGMVGDGINDAPALAKSTVGIAMGAFGSDTAIETANIALMNDKLSSIPYLIRLSRKTVNTIKYNTIGAISIKLIFIVLAFLGMGNLVFAIAADVGLTLVVILISLNILKFK